MPLRLDAAATNDGQRSASIPNALRRRLAPCRTGSTLIAIAFPKFSDGRGFSLARRCATQGYAGTLRATGALIPDQFAFALHVGFDEVEISDDARPRASRSSSGSQALTAYHDSYQDGRDGTASILDRAGAGREAAA